MLYLCYIQIFELMDIVIQLIKYYILGTIQLLLIQKTSNLEIFSNPVLFNIEEKYNKRSLLKQTNDNYHNNFKISILDDLQYVYQKRRNN